MAPLASRDFLRLWETAAQQDGLERALTLLAAAWPGTPRDVLARLPIGDRDARLLDLHVETFGRAATAAVACGECGERVEFALDLQALRVERPGNRAGEVAADGWTLRLRAPDPAAQPEIDFNMLTEEFDRARLREALHLCVRLAEHASWADILGPRLAPTDDTLADDAALDSGLVQVDPAVTVSGGNLLGVSLRLAPRVGGFVLTIDMVLSLQE